VPPAPSGSTLSTFFRTGTKGGELLSEAPPAKVLRAGCTGAAEGESEEEGEEEGEGVGEALTHCRSLIALLPLSEM